MELNRAKIIDLQFTKAIQSGSYPSQRSATTPEQANLNKTSFLELFDAQLISRHLDLIARKLKEQNKSFYTIAPYTNHE